MPRATARAPRWGVMVTFGKDISRAHPWQMEKIAVFYARVDYFIKYGIDKPPEAFEATPDADGNYIVRLKED